MNRLQPYKLSKHTDTHTHVKYLFHLSPLSAPKRQERERRRGCQEKATLQCSRWMSQAACAHAETAELRRRDLCLTEHRTGHPDSSPDRQYKVSLSIMGIINMDIVPSIMKSQIWTQSVLISGRATTTTTNAKPNLPSWHDSKLRQNSSVNTNSSLMTESFS